MSDDFAVDPLTEPLRTVTVGVLCEVLAERRRQDEKWGEQNHPDGTGGDSAQVMAESAKLSCDYAAKRGEVTYRHILKEEVAEALAETDKARLRDELIQVAAVCVQWVEKLDREVKR